MDRHPEHEEKSVASDRGKSSDSKAEDDSTPPSKAELVRLKLKLIANYAMRGFAPVVAVLALAIAMIAVTGNESSQALLSKVAARIDSMSASLSASKGELRKLKAATAQEKAMQEEERKKQDERVTKIIQNVTQLQEKMRIFPTLEEQLYQPASASDVTSSAVMPSAVMPSVASAVAAPATKAVSTDTDKKPGIRTQGLKEAIEKFNKK